MKTPTTEKKHTILIIDDEPPIRELLSEFFAERGYQVRVAPDGESALRQFEQAKPDVVLCDIALGDADGMDLLVKFKRQSPKIPVIMYTGMGFDDELIDEAIRLGASDFLSKAISLDPVLGAVARVLSAETVAPILHTENLVGYLERKIESMESHLDKGKVRIATMLTGAMAHTLKGEFLNMAASLKRVREFAGNCLQIQDECSVIEESIDLSQIFLRRLIDFLEIGKPHLTSIIVSDLRDRIASLVKPRLASSVGFVIKADDVASKLIISVDLEQLLSVMLELIHNASKLLREKGGIIELGFEAVNGNIAITIKDNGPGIADEIKNNLFKGQVKSTRGGMGLGLFLCCKVVSNLGGELSLESSSDQGCVFKILLPAILPTKES